MTQDEVLFAFHRYVDNPKPDDVGWWVKAFPQYADEIRAHAVEVIDMNFRVKCNEQDIATENLTLTSEVRRLEMEIRKLSHECLGESIRLLRSLMQRPDCDIPGESWLFLAIGTMENRQKEIAEAQMRALGGDDEKKQHDTK